MLITLNTYLKCSILAEKPPHLVFKSNHWFDLWFIGLPPTGCRSKVDLIHTDPNQAFRSGQTYRFRSQSLVGWPTFSLTVNPTWSGSLEQGPTESEPPSVNPTRSGSLKRAYLYNPGPMRLGPVGFTLRELLWSVMLNNLPCASTFPLLRNLV